MFTTASTTQLNYIVHRAYCKVEIDNCLKNNIRTSPAFQNAKNKQTKTAICSDITN